jgi:outer membrane lipoprotein-sorting protein
MPMGTSPGRSGRTAERFFVFISVFASNQKRIFMQSGRNLVFFILLALVLIPARSAFAAGDLSSTLQKLDAAAARFHSAAADFVYENVQTEPVPDTEVQKGIVYYRREGSSFQMGVHINLVDGRPVPKVVVCCRNGVVELYQKLINQVTRLTKLGQYKSYFILGFGASGRELAAKWNIKDDGPEMVNGVNTEKLEMTPKDPAIRKNLPEVSVWMDLETGVSLKQVFDEGQGQTRTATYTNVRINHSLPHDAFTFKTDSHTTYVNQ